MSSDVLRHLRQRGSVAMGWFTVALFGAMAVISLVGGEPSLVLVGSMLFAAAAGYVLFVRPEVALTLDGVDVRNPLRDTHIPWSALEDVSARWNLQVYSGGKSYAAWAIASHIERPRGGSGLFGLGRLGSQAAGDAGSAPAPSGGATVGSGCQLIEETHEEWAELVAAGHPNGRVGGTLTRTWDWLDIALLGVPLVLVAIGLLT